MRKTYRVHFEDGNQRLLEAESIADVVKHITEVEPARYQMLMELLKDKPYEASLITRPSVIRSGKITKIEWAKEYDKEVKE